MKNVKVAAIGDKDVISAFTALGFEIFPYTREYKVRETIKKLAEEEYQLILITERCASEIGDFLATYASQPYPIILPIPDGVKSIGVGHAQLDANIKKVHASKGGSQ